MFVMFFEAPRVATLAICDPLPTCHVGSATGTFLNKNVHLTKQYEEKQKNFQFRRWHQVRLTSFFVWNMVCFWQLASNLLGRWIVRLTRSWCAKSSDLVFIQLTVCKHTYYQFVWGGIAQNDLRVFCSKRVMCFWHVASNIMGRWGGPSIIEKRKHVHKTVK